MRRCLTAWIALALMSAAWLSGCAGRPADSTPTREPATSPAMGETHEAAESPGVETATPVGEKATISPTRTPLTEEEIVTPDDTVPPGAQQVVQLAKEDLARKVSVAPEAITVVSMDAVNWPDTSLGCPEPGMMYAQVITPGFRVLLEAEGRTYQYHTDQGRLVVLCDEDRHAALWLPTPARGEIVPAPYSGNVEKLIDIAKRDLARRLAIAPEEIDVVSIETAEWPDTRLGCGEPGLTRLPVAIPGYRVVLSAGGHNHVYHTDRDSGVVYCPKG